MKLNSRRDFLRVCLTKSISTPKIILLAKRIVSETGCCQRQQREERRIIRHRICEKDRQIVDSRRRINRHMKNIFCNGCLSDVSMRNLMSSVVRGLADELQGKMNTEVISTEEMKQHIKITNTKVQKRILTTYPATLRPRRERTIPLI